MTPVVIGARHCPWAWSCVFRLMLLCALGIGSGLDGSTVRAASSKGSETDRSRTAPKAAPRTAPPPQERKPDGGVTQFPAMSPRDPSQAVEERLRRGQADQPIAQGEISERLEQFYRDSEPHPLDRPPGQ